MTKANFNMKTGDTIFWVVVDNEGWLVNDFNTRQDARNLMAELNSKDKIGMKYRIAKVVLAK